MSGKGLVINQIIVFDVNGISIFSKSFKDVGIDHALLSAFFSAMRQFAQNIISGEIEGVKIGRASLNFKLLPMEDDTLMFVMISSGFSSTDADAISDKFAEDFAINFEVFLHEQKTTYFHFKKNPNKFLDALGRFYSPICDEVAKKITIDGSISVELPLKVPADTLSRIYDILTKNPSLDEMYPNGSLDVLTEIIQTYIHSERLLDDLERKYR
ncbi:MAG: hypothetical protein ACTSUE_12560 [Promethearchaeota archaeon]